MRHLLLWLALCGATASCLHVHVHNQAEYKAGHGLEPGDRVVALWRNGFWEATVLTVEGKLVSVAWDTPPPERSMVPRDWVQRMDAFPNNPKVGTWLLCPASANWQICHVNGVEGDRVNVLLTDDGSETQLALDEALQIPQQVQQWAQRYGQRVLDQMAVQAKLKQLVPANVGAPVEEGMLVAARWHSGGWWTATVQSVNEDSVVVAWQDGSAPSPVGRHEVAPLRSAGRPAVVGDPVFCLRGGGGAWQPAVVTQRQGQQLSLLFADGEAETLAQSQCTAGRRDGTL